MLRLVLWDPPQAVDLATLARGAGKLPQKWMQAVAKRGDGRGGGEPG